MALFSLRCVPNSFRPPSARTASTDFLGLSLLSFFPWRCWVWFCSHVFLGCFFFKTGLCEVSTPLLFLASFSLIVLLFISPSHFLFSSVVGSVPLLFFIRFSGPLKTSSFASPPSSLSPPWSSVACYFLFRCQSVRAIGFFLFEGSPFVVFGFFFLLLLWVSPLPPCLYPPLRRVALCTLLVSISIFSDFFLC